MGTGQTEYDLEKQIQDDIIMDLEIKMDVGNFGEKAIEADQKRTVARK